MTDVVERARKAYEQRSGAGHWDMLCEMAAEIERLRMELNACGLDCEAYFNRCEEQAAEIDRLRVELARWERGKNLLQKTIKEIYDKPRETNK